MTIRIVNKNELEISAETQEDEIIIENMRGKQLRACAFIVNKERKISLFSDQ